jgi:hypothetical protein
MTNISTSRSVVSVEMETLTAFRDRVNGLLTALEGGPAGPTRIAAQQLAEGHLGADFQEAGHLMARYQLVHSQLHDLSTALTSQINAMGMALQVSQLGYQHVEAETLDALWTIQNRAIAAQPPVGQAAMTVAQQIAAEGKPGGTAPRPTLPPTPTSTPTGHRSS